MDIKIISRGKKKNGQVTAQIIVNGKTKHVVKSAFYGGYIDTSGNVYEVN